MRNLDTVGMIVGAIVWLLLAGGTANHLACLSTRCDSGDLLLLSLLAVGFLAPAYIAAVVLSRD